MDINKALILGMKRALNIVEDSEGDVDFSIFVIKRDIDNLKKEAEQEEENE